MTGPIASTEKPRLPSLSVGWPLLPVPDPEGRLLWPDPATSVRQRIEAILRTAPGEQLMRPRFGAGLEALVNKPNTLATRTQAHDAIVEALNQYEDRIILDSVDVDEGGDPRELRIAIAYRHRLTGAAGRVEARVPVGGG